MQHIHQSQTPSALSKTVHHMAQNVFDQAHMLMMDISKGTHAGSLESRLGGLSGAVLQLESLLESYRRMGENEPIYDPEPHQSQCVCCKNLEL